MDRCLPPWVVVLETPFLVHGGKDNWKSDCSKQASLHQGTPSFYQKSKSFRCSASRMRVMLGWPNLRILPFVWQPENRNQNSEYHPAMKHLATAPVQLCSKAVSLSKMHKFSIPDAVLGMIAFRLLQSLKPLQHHPSSAMSGDAGLSSHRGNVSAKTAHQRGTGNEKGMGDSHQRSRSGISLLLLSL